MAYEERESGSHVMTCDTPGCHVEMVSPGREELNEDLALAGWVAAGKDQHGNVVFQCPECGRGQHPGAAVMKRMLGGDEATIEAPCNVRQGDEVHDDQGNLVGHYMHDADQGDAVKVKVKFPEPEVPPSVVELYDQMLEGTDDDDDALGRVSAVAPRDAGPMDILVPAPVPRSLDSAPGADQHLNIVKAAKRPDTKSAEAQEKLRRAPAAPRGPTLDTANLNEVGLLFDNIDTSWDPDGAE